MAMVQRVERYITAQVNIGRLGPSLRGRWVKIRQTRTRSSAIADRARDEC